MVVYVELAFFENFCLDFLLLALTAYAAKAAPKIGRLLLGAGVGAAFALLFPLLSLPDFLKWALKISVGAVLPLIALGRRKWGIGGAFFFLFTLAFGGALLGGAQDFPKWVRFPLFLAFAFLTLVLVGKLYKRRAVFAYIYDCEVRVGDKRIKARGFLDSGNLATKEGVPVCFLSPDLFYDIWQTGEEEGGQGCDEMQIFTPAGAKKTPLRKGALLVKKEGGDCEERVYFALGGNMIGREYKIILHSRILFQQSIEE